MSLNYRMLLLRRNAHVLYEVDVQEKLKPGKLWDLKLQKH